MSLYLSVSTMTRFIPCALLVARLIVDNLKCDIIGFDDPFTGIAQPELDAAEIIR